MRVDGNGSRPRWQSKFPNFLSKFVKSKLHTIRTFTNRLDQNILEDAYFTHRLKQNILVDEYFTYQLEQSILVDAYTIIPYPLLVRTRFFFHVVSRSRLCIHILLLSPTSAPPVSQSQQLLLLWWQALALMILLLLLMRVLLLRVTEWYSYFPSWGRWRKSSSPLAIQQHPSVAGLIPPAHKGQYRCLKCFVATRCSGIEEEEKSYKQWWQFSSPKIRSEIWLCDGSLSCLLIAQGFPTREGS